MVREESRERSASSVSVERKGAKRLDVVAGEGVTSVLIQWLVFSRSGSSEEGRPRFDGTVVQAGGTGWCEDGEVIVVRCSGRVGRKLQNVGEERRRALVM
jgi:hypothetical protein